MKLKNLLLLTSVLFLSYSQVKADTALIVQKTDGTTEQFLLSTEPVVTFDAVNSIFSTTEVSVSIPRKDISDFHFKGDVTGIKAMKPSKVGDVAVSFVDGNTVRITGLGDKKVVVYAIDGSVVGADVMRGGSETTVSMGNLGNGVYIIKYGNNSIKVIRK